MKLKSMISAGLFAAIAALSMGAQAASDSDKAAEAKAPAAAKYRHPHTGETWTGKGRAPNWVGEWEKSGHNRQELLIA